MYMLKSYFLLLFQIDGATEVDVEERTISQDRTNASIPDAVTDMEVIIDLV